MTNETEITIELTITDRELCSELQSYPEGAGRHDFAINAMRIGALALRQAQGRIDAELVRAEGNLLMRNMAQELSAHQDKMAQEISSTLKDYFDPESGRFDQRVQRLISKDGELEQLIGRQIGSNGSELSKTLTDHVGKDSVLMQTLNPDANSGIINLLTKATEQTLSDQRERILNEFSLDNGDGALTRLVNELKRNNGDLMGEFSLDKEDSALARLISRVERAQQKITSEFSLDAEGSALARMRRELVAVLEEQSKQNNEFQADVQAKLAEMITRREESRRSTRHGLEFEDAVFRYVNENSQKAGDIATKTGNTTGIIRNNKKGDVVIELGPEQDASGAKIVVEAKENASYTLSAALNELDEARKNREAGIGLFVFSARTAPEDLQPILRYGDDIIIVWDTEDTASDVIFNAGISVAKALCFRAQGGSVNNAVADFDAIERVIREIERQANGLNEITTSAETIKRGSERILNRARIVREALEKQVAFLDERLEELREIVGETFQVGVAA